MRKIAKSVASFQVNWLNIEDEIKFEQRKFEYVPQVLYRHSQFPSQESWFTARFERLMKQIDKITTHNAISRKLVS